MRQRSRRLALGALSGIGEVWPRPTPMSSPEPPKPNARMSDSEPKPALARPTPTRQTAQKWRLNFLCSIALADRLARHLHAGRG